MAIAAYLMKTDTLRARGFYELDDELGELFAVLEYLPQAELWDRLGARIISGDMSVSSKRGRLCRDAVVS